MWATIAIMVLLGMAVPLADRGAGGVRGQRARWVEESIVWERTRGGCMQKGGESCKGDPTAAGDGDEGGETIAARNSRHGGGLGPNRHRSSRDGGWMGGATR